MKVIFGREMCSGCQETKKRFKEEGVEFKYYDIDTDPEALAILSMMGIYGKGGDLELPIILDSEEIDRVPF